MKAPEKAPQSTILPVPPRETRGGGASLKESMHTHHIPVAEGSTVTGDQWEPQCLSRHHTGTVTDPRKQVE